MLAELRSELRRKYPDGIPFDNPMALRLLQQAVDYQDWHLQTLKAKTFKLSNGLWFFPEQCCGAETQSAIFEQAASWLEEYGMLSLEKLRETFKDQIRNVSSTADFIVLLRAIHFIWDTDGTFAFKATRDPSESRREAAAQLERLIEDAGGTLVIDYAAEQFPHLDTNSLRAVAKAHLPDVSETEESGLRVWRSPTALNLPDDFAEILTSKVDQLVEFGFSLNLSNLNLALTLAYECPFREEFELQDGKVFKQVCAKHYRGEEAIAMRFFKSRQPARKRASGKSGIRAPSRFDAMGIPIGSELVFIRDSSKRVTVCDDINMVEYQGERLSVSGMTSKFLHEMGRHKLVGTYNGYQFFEYEGETLWNRRLRQEGNEPQPPRRSYSKAQNRAKNRSTETLAYENGKPVIGKTGIVLSLRTWQIFKHAGKSEKIASWIERLKNGERKEVIAREDNVKPLTIRECISNRERFLEVCQINNLRPEAVLDV